MKRHIFPPGQEPTVFTADLCAEVGHDKCPGVSKLKDTGETVMCICWCHRKEMGRSPA